MFGEFTLFNPDVNPCSDNGLGLPIFLSEFTNDIDPRNSKPSHASDGFQIFPFRAHLPFFSALPPQPFGSVGEPVYQVSPDAVRMY